MARLRSRKKLGRKIEENDGEDEASVPKVHARENGLEVNQTEKESSSGSCESEDEAPESIPLSTSKDAAIAQRQQEMAAIDSLKDKEKERRRNRDEMLKKQKEMRLGREKSRIPEEILLKVAEKQNMVAKQHEVEKPNVHMTFDDDDDNDDDETLEGEDEEPQKGIQLVVLNQTKKRKRSLLDSANAFLNNHLYGDRLKRVGTLNDMNRKRKKKYFGPAIKFSKTS